MTKKVGTAPVAVFESPRFVRPHDGGRLYVTAVEPIPPEAVNVDDEIDLQIVGEGLAILTQGAAVVHGAHKKYFNESKLLRNAMNVYCGVVGSGEECSTQTALGYAEVGPNVDETLLVIRNISLRSMVRPQMPEAMRKWVLGGLLFWALGLSERVNDKTEIQVHVQEIADESYDIMEQLGFDSLPLFDRYDKTGVKIFKGRAATIRKCLRFLGPNLIATKA